MNDKIWLYFPSEAYTLNRGKFINVPNEKTNPMDGTTTSFPVLEREPILNDGLFDIRENPHGLKISFNPNKIMNKKIGGAPLTFRELSNSFETVNEYIHKENLGNIDIRRGQFSRYDTAFDIEPSGTYDKYFPIIASLAPRMQKIKKSEKRFFENTIVTGNKSKECTIYDKTAEANLDNNIIRFEFRHKKAHKEKEWGKLTLKKLTPSTFDAIRTNDYNMINSYVFSQEPKFIKNEFEEIMLQYFLELIENPGLNSTRINKQTICFFLNYLRTKEDIPVDKILKVKSSSPTYRRNNDYITSLLKYPSGDSVFIERYLEMKNLYMECA